MLSGLLITIDILVCIALVGVVLMQRSEGGGFVSGGPSGLVTARGAGNLLTRATWVLFMTFLAISVSLTLLGAHDRATSNILQRLKLQQANPNALSQPAPPPPTTAPVAPLTAPQPQGPLSAPAPQAAASAPTPPAPAAPAHRAAHERKPAEIQPAAPNLEAPAPQPAPSLEAPAPQPAPTTQP
jgi:preprotein translocase subunit SecG